MKSTQVILLKILVPLAYIAMVTVNYLANALPIGGVTTGQASDSYGNLFTPAGLTFSIWGLIYLLLAVFVVFFVTRYGKKSDKKMNGILEKTGKLFIVNALANLSWIFAWHYGLIPLSVAIMLVLLWTLIMLADLLNKEKFPLTEKVCLLLPFSIYFGWITVATIANITVFLVSIGWNGFGIADFIWTVIILLVGALIGILRMNKDKNIAYGMVLVWAYLGILLKHLSAEGFNGQYPIVIATVIACLVLFVFFAGRIFYKSLKR